jgi:hypothetical protein
MSIEFVLNDFESEVTLDLSGDIQDREIPVLTDISATAIIYVSTQSFLDAFKIQTDASDVDDVVGSDIKYFFDKTAWDGDAGLARRPTNAMMNIDASVDANLAGVLSTDGAENAIGTSGANAGAYAADRMFVCHDFVRYLALKLFNTHFGVDLFNNEENLLRSLSRAGQDVLDAHAALLDQVDVSNQALPTFDGKGYTTDDDTDVSLNITRVLFEKMMNSQDGRARLATDLSNNDGLQSVPFKDGDSLSFKLTINPTVGQNELTGVSAFGGRVYEIKYVLVGERQGDENRLNTDATGVPDGANV